MEKKIRTKNIIFTIFLIIFVIGVIVATYNIVLWYIDSKKTRRMLDEVSKNINQVEEKNENKDDLLKEQSIKRYSVDFESLKQINSDVVAWVKVNGTNIENTIVKCSDNDYYLTHSFDRSYNSAGWLFADYRNKMDGNDRNIIVYGHNIKDGSMFNTLKNVIKKDWYENEENHVLLFITERGEERYEVFSVYQIDAHYYDNKTDFYSDYDFITYVNIAIDRSYYNFGVEVTGNDKIITLSTCADDNRYRIILHAKKIS